MGKIILYHGTSDKIVTPVYGRGEEKHDYGKGFYLTENIELAKEWAVCRPNDTNGWLHKYELDMDGLNVLDFETEHVLVWLAELMKHRDAADSRRYKVLAGRFIVTTCSGAGEWMRPSFTSQRSLCGTILIWIF